MVMSTHTSQRRDREACIQQTTGVILRSCPAGLRARPPAVEGRRPQLIDNFRAAAVGGRAAAAGGRAAKALPPMYHAERLAPSATDNITNAMALDYSMSQVNENASASTSKTSVSLSVLVACCCLRSHLQGGVHADNDSASAVRYPLVLPVVSL